MKILINSLYGEGLWFGLRLEAEGHTVSYYIVDKHYEHMLEGLINKPLTNWPKEKEREHISRYDLVLFDFTNDKTQAEADRCKTLTPTIGNGTLHCQLEKDREFGIRTMEDCGIVVPPYETFNNLAEAKKFIQKTGKRYVFKPFGESKTETTYVSKSPEDLLKFIDNLGEEVNVSKGFLLQEFIKGEEISVEGYFDGNEFYLINATLEEKKFMNDNLGPNTGCSGNLAWIFNTHEARDLPKVFVEGLGKTKEFLQLNNFTGMIDLNSIVTDRVLYGLEWTPRFGYDASATLLNLIDDDKIGDFLHAIASGNGESTIGMRYKGKYGASVRISIPPYPNDATTEPGIPVEGIEPEDLNNVFVHDVMLDRYSKKNKATGQMETHNELTTAGGYGFVCAPLAYGISISEAFENLDKLVDKIQIPNLQYRSDICKSTTKRYNKLRELNWF